MENLPIQNQSIQEAPAYFHPAQQNTTTSEFDESQAHCVPQEVSVGGMPFTSSAQYHVSFESHGSAQNPGSNNEIRHSTEWSDYVEMERNKNDSFWNEKMRFLNNYNTIEKFPC